MEETNQQEIKSMERCHIVAVPFPARGLINPMMNFCKHLAHKLGDNVKITFVVTEEWFGILEPAPIPPQIHLRSIPNVIPSEFVRSSTLDFETFLEIAVAEMQAPFEHVMNTSEPATVILADFSLIWAFSIGNRRNIPVVSFWTASSFMFSVLSHADLLTKNGHSLDHSSDCYDEVINYIPGVSTIRLSDMPFLPRGNDPNFNPEMVAFTLLDKVQCLLLPTFYELEPQVTDTLKEIVSFPVYTIGPSVSNLNTTINQHHQFHDKKKESARNEYANSKELYYLKWLDSQPISSVMYIAFGSTVSISGEQMEEILAGLHESGIQYLLVSRGAWHLSAGIHGDGGGDRDDTSTSSRGLVVPWCDQLRVLCHSSVGGFWTHCGWNSVMESIYAGVPMLTFPMYFDQIPNRKLIVDDLKVGMEVMKEFGAKTLVKRGEVERIVKKFMNMNGKAEEDFNNEVKEMRRRSSELKDITRKALEKGGSSDTNLNSFIKDILHFHGN